MHLGYSTILKMSHSVIKQALQLMQDDLNPAGAGSTGKKRKSKNAMKLIPTNRKGVWKELRRLQKQEQDRVRNKHEKPDFKSSIEKLKDDQLASQAAKAKSTVPVVKKPAHSKNAKKVFELHMKHLNQRNASQASEEEESTVFTDRDFDKFEEEYDFV